MSIVSKLNELIKSVEGAIDEMEKATKKSEVLEKPPVSEAQRKAMHAAANGNSTLGIPKGVGKEFADADKGGKLPEKAKKAEDEEKDKAEKAAGAPKTPKIHTIDYSQMKTPKAPEAAAPTINYSHTAAPVRTPGETEEGFKVPAEKKKPLSDPAFRTKLTQQRRAAGVVKSEQFGIFSPEALTKSIRSRHSDGEITEMLKAAVDNGSLHRNVLLEWANFRTINPSVLQLASDEE